MTEYKPPLHLIPRAALLAEAQAFDSQKNGRKPWDWMREDVSLTDQVRGALSHCTKWLDREDTDPETGLHHLGHARARLAIALALIDRSLGTDDRMPDVGRPASLHPFVVKAGALVEDEREDHINWIRSAAPTVIERGPDPLPDAVVNGTSVLKFERRAGDYCPSAVEHSKLRSEGKPLCAKCLGAPTVDGDKFCQPCAKETTVHPEAGTVVRPKGSLCDACARDDLDNTVGHGAG